MSVIRDRAFVHAARYSVTIHYADGKIVIYWYRPSMITRARNDAAIWQRAGFAATVKSHNI